MSKIVVVSRPEFSGIPCKVAGIVPRGDETGQLNLDDHMSRSERRIMSLASCYAMVAASEAMTQARWAPTTEEDKCRSGSFF